MNRRRLLVLAASLSGIPGCDTVQGWISSQGEPATAPGDTPTDDPAEASPSEPMSGFVVLEHDTPLHRRPSPEAPALTLSFGPDTRKGRRFAAFEVVETRDGWMRVRPLDAEAGTRHCAGSWAPLHDLDVALWVQRTDLVWVVRAGTLVEDGRGASAMLAAGTPLERGASEADPVHVPQLGIAAPLPDSAIGRTYTAGALFPVPKPIAGRPLDALPLRFGDNAIDLQTFDLTEQSPPRLPVHLEKNADGDKTLVGIGTPCVELRVLESGSTRWLREGAPTPPAVVAPPEAPPRPGAWKVEAGAEVFWPDMEAAGTTRAAHVFSGQPTRKSDKRCFEFGAGWSRVCVRADDLGKVGEPEPTPEPPEPEPPEPEPTPEPPEPEPTPEPPKPEPTPEPPEPTEPEPTPEPTPEPPEPEPTEPSEGPSLSVYKAQITGSLGRKAVAHTLKLRHKEALGCYTEQLADDASLSGTLQLVLTISPEGAVKSATIRNDKIGNRALRQCLTKAAKHWGFPRPDGGGLVVVKQTLRFTP